jgi:Phosphoribosylformylglycinamidine (FGAM) synthase, glutamine amidotransferase domain
MKIKPKHKNILKIPVAHGDGRYYADEKTLDQLEKNKQVLYRYCNEKGLYNEDCSPNGSITILPGFVMKKEMFSV